jgi:hypothetical protein
MAEKIVLATILTCAMYLTIASRSPQRSNASTSVGSTVEIIAKQTS